MKSRRMREEGIHHVQVLKVGISLLVMGSVLFAFVWWPIQAERALVAQRQWDKQLADKKAEFIALQTRYDHLTSLTVLDQWATKNGPWRSPTSDDVILLQS